MALAGPFFPSATALDRIEIFLNSTPLLLSLGVDFLQQAVEAYKVELSRYGADALVDERILVMAQEVIDQSLVTLLESQLVRSLSKEKGLQPAACDKYLKK